MTTGGAVWHNGQTSGASSLLAIDRARGRAAVALWNAAYPVDDVALCAIGALARPRSLPVEAPRTPAEIAALCGAYDGYLGTFTVTRDETQLRMSGGRYPAQLLYACARATYFTKRLPARYAFVFSADGAVTGVTEELEGWPARVASRRVVQRKRRRRAAVDR